MEFGKYYYYYSIGAAEKLPSCRPLLLTTPAMTRAGPPAESRVAWYTNTPLYLVTGRVRARVTVRVRVRVMGRVRGRVRGRGRGSGRVSCTRRGPGHPRRARSGAPPNIVVVVLLRLVVVATISSIYQLPNTERVAYRSSHCGSSGGLTVVSEPLGDTYVHGAVPG